MTRCHTRRQPGFTLAEMLITIAILAFVVVFVARMLDSVASIVSAENKRMDADATARPLFERLAADLRQMVRRQDVTFYLKNSADTMAGNDLMAFYSSIPGFYPSTPSTVSVVAYRVNQNAGTAAETRLERMGKGLPWTPTSSADTPIVFQPLTLTTVWPCVTSTTTYDSSTPNSITYEIVAPDVFRFEYYYIDNTGALVTTPSGWNSAASININDISGIVTTVAVIDPKSRRLLSSAQLNTLVSRLTDFANNGPGVLASQWQLALNGITDMPRPAISAVRIYERVYDLR